MSDKEFMKALECCSAEYIACKECPLNGKSFCERYVIENTFDFINRQQAEIEKARAEAIKEFAGRLGEYIEYRYNENCDFVPYIRLKDIEKVVYEMVGMDNESKCE